VGSKAFAYYIIRSPLSVFAVDRSVQGNIAWLRGRSAEAMGGGPRGSHGVAFTSQSPRCHPTRLSSGRPSDSAASRISRRTACIWRRCTPWTRTEFRNTSDCTQWRSVRNSKVSVGICIRKCAERLVDSVNPVALRRVLQSQCEYSRKLGMGNPNAGNLGADFSRYLLDFWAAVLAVDPGSCGEKGPACQAQRLAKRSRAPRLRPEPTRRNHDLDHR
jgi:hypothetical protein